MNKRKESIIFILGMHKSGTSLIGNLLDKIGVVFGNEDTMLETDSDNVLGFYEDNSVNEINNSIFAYLGSSWDDEHFDLQKMKDKEGEEFLIKKKKEMGLYLENLIKNNSDVGIKDPRITVLFPLWLSALGHVESKKIFIYRNPNSVLKSLKRRNKFDDEKILKLWAKYNDIGLAYIDTDTDLIVKYEDVLRFPVTHTRRILEFYGVTDSEDKVLGAASTIRSSLDHSDDLKTEFEDRYVTSIFNKLESMYQKQISVLEVQEVSKSKLNQYKITQLENDFTVVDKLVRRKEEEIRQLRVELISYRKKREELNMTIDSYRDSIDQYKEVIQEQESVIKDLQKQMLFLPVRVILKLRRVIGDRFKS